MGYFLGMPGTKWTIWRYAAGLLGQYDMVSEGTGEATGNMRLG